MRREMNNNKVGAKGVRNLLFGAVAIVLGLVVIALGLSVLSLLIRDLRLLSYGQLYIGLTEIIIVVEAAIIYGCVVALLQLWDWAESGPSMKTKERPWYKKWWGIVVISLAIVYVITAHPLFRSELDKWLYSPTVAEVTSIRVGGSRGFTTDVWGLGKSEKEIKKESRLQRLIEKLRQEGLVPLWAEHIK